MESASNPAENRLVGGLPPPPGVVPDFNNPALGYVIVSFAICLIMTTLVVWVRMYTVFFVIKSHGWADCKNLVSIKLLYLSLTLNRYFFSRMGKVAILETEVQTSRLIKAF